MTESARLTAVIDGYVQGVGFRWSVRARAADLGTVTGHARNLADGRVEVVAEGAREECAQLLDWLRTGDTPGRVDTVTEHWGPATSDHDGFTIR
ncbi:acylphosphatase [Kitasatospora gansuensis]|uniref:acylphosphatase n=1 Tax=Kitasatospora gansuensis TaxID=258050 RepID=A0A7W7WME3_9ACTN|nr:acylphosphatase [Kitasatospora gansuensis]MBB4951689.1 acylphosphatase [Kitasatospora gansuensis]